MAPPVTRAGYADELGTELVSIYAGPGRKHYVVHKNLLTSQSDYFDRALNGGFKEAEESAIHLEEEDPAAVGLLVGWLYRGVIPGVERPSHPFIKYTAAERGLASYIDTTGVALPEQGTTSSFEFLYELDAHSNLRYTNYFANICCDDTYRNYSQEELRMADYSANRKYRHDNPNTPASTAVDFAPLPGYFSSISAVNSGDLWEGLVPSLTRSTTIASHLQNRTPTAFGAHYPHHPPPPPPPPPALGLFGPRSNPSSALGGLVSSGPPVLSAFAASVLGPSFQSPSGTSNTGTAPTASVFGYSGYAASSGASRTSSSTSPFLTASTTAGQSSTTSGTLDSSGTSTVPSNTSSFFGYSGYAASSGASRTSSSTSPFLTASATASQSSTTSGTSDSSGTLTVSSDTSSLFGYSGISALGPSSITSSGASVTGETPKISSGTTSLFAGNSTQSVPSVTATIGSIFGNSSPSIPGSAIAHSSSILNRPATTSTTSLFPSLSGSNAPILSGPTTSAINTAFRLTRNESQSSSGSSNTDSTSTSLPPTTTSTAPSTVNNATSASNEEAILAAPQSSLFGGIPTNRIGATASPSSSSLFGSSAVPPPTISLFGTSTSNPSGFAALVPPPSGSIFRNDSSNSATPSPTPKPAPTNPNKGKKPGEFGYAPNIKYPEPEGVFIDGIPRSDESLSAKIQEDMSFQSTLLSLCLLAETLCWPKLYNASIDAYIEGELNLHRSIPYEHVDLIYNRTHSESTLRNYVVASIQRIGDPEGQAHLEYMSLAQEHEDFLENLLRALSLSGKGKVTPHFEILRNDYFIPEDAGVAPRKAFESKGKEKEK